MKSYLKFNLISQYVFAGMLCLLVTSIMAQPEKYKEREQEAPEHIRQQLEELRAMGAQNEWTFEVGYTKAMDVELNALAATKMPENWLEDAARQNELAEEIYRLEKEYMLERQLILVPKACHEYTYFSWKDRGKVTPVRDQRLCGSCWAFGALGAYESNFAIRNGLFIDGSEQDILSCAKSGTCKGGWYRKSFLYMISTGVATEKAVPYKAVNGTCKKGVAKPYRAVNWGYVDTKKWMPSVDALKKALCEHGALAVGVRATDAFQAYTGGVFNEKTKPGINHRLM